MMQGLLLDCGNTRLRVRSWSGDGPAPADGVAGNTVPLQSVAEFSTPESIVDPLKLSSALRSLRIEAGNPPVVLVSVVPALTGTLVDLWNDLIVIDHRSVLPFATSIKDLSSVGPDRLCNVAAAVGAGLNDALVVDAGTATTFDLLEDGVFTGGLIAPGMAFAADQLGRFAARLDPVPFAPCPLEPGRDTASAMAAGAWHVGQGGVEAVIKGLLVHRSRTHVIVTGGLANHLAGSGRLVDPDWTLRGAALLGGLRRI
jgi:type III pantothenate kinase